MSESIRPIDWLLLALSLLCQTAAVILAKSAALRMDAPTPMAFATNAWYVGGLGCLVLQAFLWQLVLRRFRLTVAYLVTSLNYLLILAASRLVFLESVSVFNVVGSVVIAIGVFFVISGNRP
jgi:drug/metabolite transporter (DMT)-like permease